MEKGKEHIAKDWEASNTLSTAAAATELENLIRLNSGKTIYDFAARIFPICRSITGDGVRKTLEEVKSIIDLNVHEVPTGTQVFDWTIPQEWNIRSAYIMNAEGKKIVDFAKSNLHLMSYSVPVKERLSLAELKSHIHTLPEQPDVIPYRTSYYSHDWAFCMSHRDFERLKDETYEVVIESSLEDGFLTYGEYLHTGESNDEVLFSAHVCHPSLANDNCSGIALLTHLAQRMHGVRTRYTYRFLFAPGTIGAITWLALNEERSNVIKHGLIISMVGDGGPPTYKRSRRGDTPIDRAMINVLRHSGLQSNIERFSPYGYDERQYCSSGFNLPVGSFQRSKYGSIPQYHNSSDNMSFIQPEYLLESYNIIVKTISVLENDGVYLNTSPKCEPQLGRRGLYGSVGGGKDNAKHNMAMLWVLNYSDGAHSLMDIAELSELPFDVVVRATGALLPHGLLISADRRPYAPVGQS